MAIKRVIVIASFLVGWHVMVFSSESLRTLGLFTTQDKRIEGIKFGNWGSRPYEYALIAAMADVQGKRVIDLGVGLPSQYEWYKYVVQRMHPSFYAGIDVDGRIKSEEISADSYEIKYMDMAHLAYPDEFFDVAFCISTFEHIPYETFMRCIYQAHRVLKKNGILLVTLDEWWDKDAQLTHGNNWNTLEQDLQDLNAQACVLHHKRAGNNQDYTQFFY